VSDIVKLLKARNASNALADVVVYGKEQYSLDAEAIKELESLRQQVKSLDEENTLLAQAKLDLRTQLADATRKLDEARKDAEKIILALSCCETVQRLQTNSVNPRDYWQVKMKGISDPYFIGKDDLPALLKQIHEDLFINQAIEQGKGVDDE
jgi:hypothetical protein